MVKTSINYLFPPDKINDLETWHFVLHFKLPSRFRGRKVKKVGKKLKAVQWKIINVTCDLDNLPLEHKTDTVAVSIEVPEERRRQPNSLADYESDVWRIIGNMVECGFGDLYYEAVDWVED